jgi:hypothetical protein
VFDIETATLIRQAPSLADVDADTLPQLLTSIYAELVALRLRGDTIETHAERLSVLEHLRTLASVYEAVADTGAEGEPRRAAAFVSGTAHQMLGRVLRGMYDAANPMLSASSVHPFVYSSLRNRMPMRAKHPLRLPAQARRTFGARFWSQSATLHLSA